MSTNVTVTAKPTYTVTFIDHNGTVLKRETVENGSAPVPPMNPTRNGYRFTGWDSDFSSITSDITVTAVYQRVRHDSDNTPKEHIKPAEAVRVIVDNEENNEDRTILQDDKAITVRIDSRATNQIKVQLTGDIVKNMEVKEQRLTIKAGDVEYSIPAKEITIDTIAEILGVRPGSLKDITVVIEINKVDKEKQTEIVKNAATGGYEILVHPEQFRVVAKTEANTGEIRETTISRFRSYVSRTLELPEDVDPMKISTGIVCNEDGTFSHIPTIVFQKDGKWYAELNSLTNSIYSVLYNPVAIGTVENHWSKKAANDMASRLVIKSPESFVPDKAITRGEFAECITKAIGIYRKNKARENLFNDVAVTDELADAIIIAAEYGIINGYPDGTFRPDVQITREEAMTMYARAMDIVKLEEADSNRIAAYKDISQISGWAYDAAKKTINAGVFNGRTKDAIVPKGAFTYAEAATAVRDLLIKSKLINE